MIEIASYLKKRGIKEDFCQENLSYSKYKNTFRGIHFQTHPNSQAKLITVVKGKIIDVIVDLRKNSVSFGKYIK